ncbi:MurR/RpiR family transcriptional regulator [Gammaproteobacteria bacterium]|nr:MurR/RpiR family transcriptional regulator [Gammaproteobacteria bacterium]
MSRAISKSVTHDAPSLLEALSQILPALSPELQKAARFMLDQPAEIGFASVRQLADMAKVKPNTLVRLARHLGVDGFEELRRPFREQMQRQPISFTERARHLQDYSSLGKLDELTANLASAQRQNIDQLYRGLNMRDMQAAAEMIIAARSIWVLGLGVANPVARNFAYLASMAVDNVVALPRDGSLPIDSLINAADPDLLIAMTFKPFRQEVVETVRIAAQEKVQIIGISDSLACPIFSDARLSFVVPAQTPQFFTSTIAIAAFFETLLSLVIAAAGDKALQHIEQYHRRRHELGIYVSENLKL